MSALRAAIEGGWHLIPKATYQWRKAQLDLGGVDEETGDLAIRVDNGTGELAHVDPLHALQLAMLCMEYAAGQTQGTVQHAIIGAYELLQVAGDLESQR